MPLPPRRHAPSVVPMRSRPLICRPDTWETAAWLPAMSRGSRADGGRRLQLTALACVALWCNTMPTVARACPLGMIIKLSYRGLALPPWRRLALQVAHARRPHLWRGTVKTAAW